LPITCWYIFAKKNVPRSVGFANNDFKLDPGEILEVVQTYTINLLVQNDETATTLLMCEKCVLNHLNSCEE